MPSPKKSVALARKKLSRLQAERAEVAEKIERVQRKLDKRAQQMLALESKIARAERHAFALSNPNGGPALSAPENLRPAYLIFNPSSGPDGKTDRSPQPLVEALKAHGIAAEVGFKTSGKVARQLACEALERKHTLLIAAGGDGTIEDVASQLVGLDAVLGILPVGSRNNIARELGVPLDIDQACELIAAGITRKVDVGRVCANVRSDVEYFLETAGLGFSAVVFEAGQGIRKHRFAPLSNALRKIFEMHPGPVDLELDGQDHVMANAQVVTVSNAPLIGLNQLIAPEAKMDDGLLDVAVYDGMTSTDLAAYFLATTKGRRSPNPHVQFYRARHVKIRSTQALAIVSDTDSISARQELEIEILPRALNAIVGNGIALTAPVESVPATPPLTGPQANPAVPVEAQGEPLTTRAPVPV